MNIVRVHQIYAAASSTGGDNVANIMVPYKGMIVAASLVVVSGTAAAINAELSFQSANQLTQNDATSILISAMWNGAATAPDVECVASGFVNGVAIPVDSISKIYAHLNVAGSVAWRLKGTLWIHTRA